LLSDEAEELLLRSIPARLRRTEPEKTHRHALILLDELGRLPLAIAQAAANIRDQNLSLAEYADLYKDKSQRMDLLRLPAEDSFKADPSKSSQSIFITWEISFDCLRNDTLASKCLAYMGCFSFLRIPRDFLMRLPEFKSFKLSQFQQAVMKIIRLNLADQEEVKDGSVEYNIHPLVHERIFDRLSHEDQIASMTPCIELLADEFPLLASLQDEAAHIKCLSLAPHAERLSELIFSMNFESEATARLLQGLASFQSLLLMSDNAAVVAARALCIFKKLFNQDYEKLFPIQDLAISCLNDAARYEEALAETEIAVRMFRQEEAKGTMQTQILKQRWNRILGQRGTALLFLQRYGEYKETIEKLISNSDENDPNWPQYQLDLLAALFNLRKLDKAQALITSLLRQYSPSENAPGKRYMRPNLYNTLVHTKGQILHITLRGHAFGLPKWQEVFDL
jgi:hypothetical protein